MKTHAGTELMGCGRASKCKHRVMWVSSSCSKFLAGIFIELVMLELESLLEAKLPVYSRWPVFLRKTLLGVLNWVLCISRINAFLAINGHLRGTAFVQASLAYLSVKWHALGEQRIPKAGPLVVVANHPNGIVDGMALYLSIHRIRPDIRIVVNDVLCQFEPMDGVFLPVVNVGEGCNRTHQVRIVSHLQAGGAILLFPSGEVSRLTRHGVRDCHWRKGFLHFAHSVSAPILPVFIKSRNSWWFYLAGLIASPLAMLLLPGEIFRSQGREIHLQIGNVVPWTFGLAAQSGFGQLPAYFRQKVYALERLT